MRLLSLATLASVGIFLSGTPSSNGFVPSSGQSAARPNAFSSTQLQMEPSARESEKLLRQELAERTSKVENEEQYAIKDGTGLETTITTEDLASDDDEEGYTALAAAQKDDSVTATATATATDASTKLQKKLDRLIKQRPYPLFLMEKGFEIVEDLVEDIVGGENASFNSQKREKVVVLGTGWGAAAFLKGIDTSLYDVTVISPRNYFLFTPMLAGSAVGTVDYRSITEPVREVSR